MSRPLVFVFLLALSACAQPVTAPSSAPVYPSGPGTTATTSPTLSGAPLNTPEPASTQPSVADRSGAPTPRPTGGIGKPARATNPHPPKDGVTGTATWFDAPWGTAAAGPALRDYLGTDWRGKRVSVTAPGCGCPAVVVILDDWCFCGGGRVIDLNRSAFANLAMPSLGIVKVVVREVP